MESENSQYLLPWSSSLALQDSVESVIGSFITLISTYDVRYEGVLYLLNLQDSVLGLQNVICYGTEERSKNNEFQVPPFNKVYDYIVFSGVNIKEIIVKPSRSYNGGYYGYSGRGATSNKPRNAAKPPLPLTVSSNSSHGAKIRRKIPSIANEKLIKPQATTDFNAFSVNGLVNDRLLTASNPLAQPQYSGSNFYAIGCDDHVYHSMPYGHHVPDQDPINNVTTSQFLDSSASGLMSSATQSFFTTFPPAPVSMPPKRGGLDCEAKSKNFSQYEVWGPPKKEDTAKPYYIDGAFYMISRQPFDPIGKPCNPFGPIAKRGTYQ